MKKKMKTDMSSGLIQGLDFGSGNQINTWGVEFADSNSFFSIEDGVGLRCKEEINSKDIQDVCVSTDRVVTLSEGVYKLATRDDASQGDSIIREIEAVALEDGYLMDFVMRYRFKKESVETVLIDNKKIYHIASNIYHQYDVSSVDITFYNGLKAKLEILDSVVPEGMKEVMYVRDQRDEWVIHCRFIPTRADKEVIKVCTSWAGTRSLPGCVTRLILGVGIFKRFLWYKAEVRPYRSILLRYFFNLSAYPMICISKGETLRLKSIFRLYK